MHMMYLLAQDCNNSLLPYFGCKRNLSGVMFRQIAEHIPREEWNGMTFVDAFLGSGAASLYAKAQGFRVVCNDIAERSYLAGMALINNNDRKITDEDIGEALGYAQREKRFHGMQLNPKRRLKRYKRVPESLYLPAFTDIVYFFKEEKPDGKAKSNNSTQPNF